MEIANGSLRPQMAPHPAALRFRSSRGFTLIELLTVIAIIGILAAIIIPTVGKVRAHAKKVQCISNLRQWGQAVRLFANDHKGFIASYNNLGTPSGGYDPQIYNRYFGTKTMIDPTTGVGMPSQEAMSRCPQMRAKSGEADYVRRCYGFTRPYNSTTGKALDQKVKGSMLDLDPAQNFNAYNLSKLQNPSRFVMMVEMSPVGNGSDTGQITVNKPAELETTVRGMQTGNAASGKVTPRHGGSANMLYGDGHVRTFSATETDYTNGSSAVKAEIENWFRL